MPSLKIAMRNVQVFSVGMLYQQSPHDRSTMPIPSDASSIDPSGASNVSVDSSSVFESEVFSTSTPKKAISTPADSQYSHQNTETISQSQSFTSFVPSSKASTESSDNEDTIHLTMNAMVIEQLQFHPSRVWDRK